MRNGKAKGDDFENRVCRLLSIWLVPGDWKKAKVWALPFRRRFTDTTPLDGHWTGSGDVLHRPGIKFPFTVECKKQEKWELDGMFGAPKWRPWKWWSQARDQAYEAGLHPLLIFTRNCRPLYVLMEKEIAEWLHLKPKRGPVLRVERPAGPRLVLAVMDDLTAVPRARVAELA